MKLFYKLITCNCISHYYKSVLANYCRSLVHLCAATSTLLVYPLLLLHKYVSLCEGSCSRLLTAPWAQANANEQILRGEMGILLAHLSCVLRC